MTGRFFATALFGVMFLVTAAMGVMSFYLNDTGGAIVIGLAAVFIALLGLVGAKTVPEEA